ncbi:TIGR02117 family protein [Erythrobacter sp. Alg231-14]|uniref:TIGR02117 family protein n=1 Tax=Erythrobacter sp. Alg231-14 TaxID=1922225 RepID=UPI000D554325
MLVKVKAAAKWSVIGLIGMVSLFFLVAWIGSSMGRNGEWTEPVAADERTIEIMVGSNGIHTEIAMPLVTREKDWRTTFSIEDIRVGTRPYTHVAVSWGERAFFLETPEWTDLTVTTAVNAMTGGEAVLHVAYYVRPAASNDYRVLRLRESEYRALVQSIESQLVEADNRETIPGYSWHDVFYSAHGTYHIGNTCNQWTSDQLAAAGVNVGIWSPLPGGVMKWVPDAP